MALSGLWGGGRGALAESKVEGSTRGRALPSKVYPAGKLQRHFTCGFVFRHDLGHDCHLWLLL